MDLWILATGIAVGIAVAAPIGPINLMCIQRTLQSGFWAGLATGVGAVLGDGVFAVVSAFGVTWVADLISGYESWLQFVGGMVLLLIGIKTIRSPASQDATIPTRVWQDHGGLVGTTFLLTITNPATLFGFVAIFSGVGGLVAASGDYARAGSLVVAVMAGSLLWWIFVSRIVATFRKRISVRGLVATNRLSGTIILTFGIAVLVNLLF